MLIDRLRTQLARPSDPDRWSTCHLQHQYPSHQQLHHHAIFLSHHGRTFFSRVLQTVAALAVSRGPCRINGLAIASGASRFHTFALPCQQLMQDTWKRCPFHCWYLETPIIDCTHQLWKLLRHFDSLALLVQASAPYNSTASTMALYTFLLVSVER